MLRRLSVAVLAWTIVLAACGSSSTPDPSTPVTPDAPQTSASDEPAPSEPSTTSAAAPTDSPPPSSLSIEEAVAALEAGSTEPAALLSILDALNIGVYAADGTPLHGSARGARWGQPKTRARNSSSF